MTTCPCKDCGDRFPTCHDSCPAYIQWRDGIWAANEALREDVRLENAIRRIKAEAVRKAMRGD